MILDNEQKLAFIHIPHCAGTTLKKQLLKNFNRYSLYLPDNLSGDFKKDIFFINNQDVNVVDHLPAKYTPKGYESFVIIKNAFHREVSQYFMHLVYQKYSDSKFTTFKDFLKFKYLSDPNTKYLSYTTGILRKRGCYDFCYTSNKQTATYIYKLENIKTVWPSFCEKYNLPKDVWDIRHNVQTQGNWRDYYDQECIDIVAKFRKKDLDTFGYTFA